MANSPWGKIQSSKVYAGGFRLVNTSSHGGYMLTERFAEKYLSKAARSRALIYQEGRWLRTLRTFYCYEEDCLWAIPALELLDLFGDKMFEHAALASEYSTNVGRKRMIVRTLSEYNADYLLEIGIEPEPDNYAKFLFREQDSRLRNEKSPDLIISVFGDWYEECRVGECMVITADGKKHFVTTESYHRRTERGGLNLLSTCVLSRNAVVERERCVGS